MAEEQQVAAVVLAAGEGKRMKSATPKVMHEVAGRPMIDRVLDSIGAAGISRIVAVTGHGREVVDPHLAGRAICVAQLEQNGTGHAVMQAEEALRDFEGPVLIACGDVPLLRAETIRAALAAYREGELQGLVMTTIEDDPTGYGRIVRSPGGAVQKIVEHKDATEEERQICEINSGTYFFDSRSMFEALAKTDNQNAQGEYYLTDVVEVLLGAGKKVGAYVIEDAAEAMGVNSPEQLARAEEIFLDKYSG